MPYTPILATLGYVLSPDGRRVLLIHRNKRPGDAHLGKYNGLGGKVEAGEDVVACLRREIREEAGIECEALRLCGTISWPGADCTAAIAQTNPSATTNLDTPIPASLLDRQHLAVDGGEFVHDRGAGAGHMSVQARWRRQRGDGIAHGVQHEI